MAQERYSDKLGNIDGVSDQWYSSYNGSSYSIEKTRNINNDSKKLMESVEGIIICLLYDLYDDSENNEAFDAMSLGHETMWSLFTNSGAKTLCDFIEHIKSMDYMKTHLSELGKLLNEYNLSTEAPTMHNFGFYCPTVEFVWNETNSNGYYNARKFSVNFYDYSFNYIGSTPEQIVSLDNGGKGYISIDADLWQSVLELDSTFYVSVTVGEYDGNVNNQGDGYFITKYESEFSKYDFSDLVQRIYYEESVSQILEGGDFYWYKFVAPMNGEYIFETTGSTDTCGELFTTLVIGTSINNMIISNDDDGENTNFKIVYSLNKGETIYLRVSGYNEESSGEYILSVTSPNHIHDYTYQYSNPTAMAHKASCCCGAFILEDHEYINKLGSLRCKHCSYTTNGPVVWNSLFDGNNNEIYCILNENEKGVLV
jgi:hypothetical protein